MFRQIKRTNFVIILLCIIVILWSPLQASYRIKGTNRNYQQGDWITYSTTRFVRNLAIGDRFIYFATTGGITRYNFFSDSWDFPWTISNGLADNNIYLVAMDFATGYLWCTHDAGISYLEPASQLWNNIYYDELPLSANENITSLGFGDYKVFLSTSDYNYYGAESLDANFYFLESGQSNYKRITSEHRIKWHGELAPPEPELMNMFMSDGYFFDEGNRRISDLQFRRYPITCWAYDKWRNLWIGTWGLGAGRGDLNTIRLNLLINGLWDPAVDAISRDGDTFWLGGIQDNEEQPSGVTEWSPEVNYSKYYESYLLTGFDNDRITSIAVDDNIVWFGTQDGLTRYDRDRNNWRTLTVVDNLVDNFVHDIVIDDSYIWAATERGVSRLNKAPWGSDSLKIHHVLYPSLGNIAVYDIEKQYNLLWMATEFGVFVYDIEKNTGGFYQGAEGPAALATFAVSGYKDEIWFGTEEGIAAFNSATKEWLNPPARLYQTDAGINRILAAKDAVWVATNEGVLKFDRARDRWVHYTILDGLSSDNVYSLYLEGDYIWFGTANGLTRFYWNSPYRID